MEFDDLLTVLNFFDEVLFDRVSASCKQFVQIGSPVSDASERESQRRQNSPMIRRAYRLQAVQYANTA